jgi:peptide/nickel transport system ATP-binding protein
MMGLIKPQRGQILFNGTPLGRDLRSYRRRVQMVFQDPTASLNPRQTIYEIVAEGLRIHRIHDGPAEAEEDRYLAPPARVCVRPNDSSSCTHMSLGWPAPARDRWHSSSSPKRRRR